MKVLIADKLSERTVQALEDLGLQVEFRPELTADDLPDAVADVNILVVRSTRVTAETIEAAPAFSLIIRAGAGVNTIDVVTASTRGIYVTNCPGKNSDSVAELAIGLLIACDRRIVDAAEALRGGKWNKKEFSKSQGLKGRTLGVLGMGMIGQAVAARARGLEMQVLAWSRSLTLKRAAAFGVSYAESPLAVAQASDAVTIHLAASQETKHLIDREFLFAMKNGAILVNTSRGNLVETAALNAAIQEKGLRVGLDVFEDEPGSGEADFAQTELARLVTATPHIGASTEQAAEAIADEVVRIVTTFRETGKPPNTVNMCARSPATHSLVVRHYNRVGVLAGVLDSLREEGINVEEMENTIFDGAKAACCTLQLDKAPSLQALAFLEHNENVLQVTLEAR
jgi:D-3-phosphoglycerate dehydrogenase